MVRALSLLTCKISLYRSSEPVRATLVVTEPAGFGLGRMAMEKPVGGSWAVNVPSRNDGCMRGLIFASVIAMLETEPCFDGDVAGEYIARSTLSYSTKDHKEVSRTNHL